MLLPLELLQNECSCRNCPSGNATRDPWRPVGEIQVQITTPFKTTMTDAPTSSCCRTSACRRRPPELSHAESQRIDHPLPRAPACMVGIVSLGKHETARLDRDASGALMFLHHYTGAPVRKSGDVRACPLHCLLTPFLPLLYRPHYTPTPRALAFDSQLLTRAPKLHSNKPPPLSGP